MRISILCCVACLALISGCVRPRAGTVTGPGEGSLREADINRSWLKPTTVGQVRLVPLLAGPRPIRGGVFWTPGAGAQRTPNSASCTDADALWFCARDRWLAGENRREGIVNPATDPDRLLVGADLGISVRFGSPQRTLVYLGDSVGVPATAGCGAARPRASCNDAILVVDPADRDAEDGVSVSVAAVEAPGGRLAGFLPLVIPGVNGADALPRCRPDAQVDLAPCLGPFNVPTGAATVRLRTALLPDAPADAEGDTEAVLLFYGTAVTREEMASWLAVSTDGFHFSKLLARPFSRERFITVAPVPLRATELAAICAAEPSSPLCEASLDLRGDAVLLFGTGEKYREGHLYLGVLRLDDLAVRYYRLDPGTGREVWVEGEREATPIIEDGSPTHAQFGEFSVSRVNAEACPSADRERCADTLVLLASQKGLVRYRTAPLAFPGARAADPEQRAWSASRRTSGRGYGPYAFDEFTRVAPDAGGELELYLYHTLSAWNGREPGSPDRTPYGVFTHRLELIDEPTCGKGGEDEILCGEIPPPWPPGP